MSASKRWNSLAFLPWKTRVLISALALCAFLIAATTLFIVIQIIRIQWHEAVDAPPVQTTESAKPEEHEPEHPAAPSFSLVYELPAMTISLGNRNQTLAAYAEFNLLLDCATPESLKWMQLNRASIRDAVYESTISFTVEDFSTSEGLTKIKKTMLEAFKQRFGRLAPREIAIQDWSIR
ncbi:flagellar basal body-associated FliL family protein [bacterium]|nr:flagellar basal body-associated FliL family protein [bacterium]